MTSTAPLQRADCEALDTADPLAGLRARFELPEDVIYLDGNSLGALPRDTAGRLTVAVREHWGRELIRSWNSAGWIGLPARIGDKIGTLVGAAPGQVIAADSTSVNLFKVLSAALALRPDRTVILSERGNFPTDLYIAQGLIAQIGRGHRLRLVERDELPGAIDGETAVVMLTQVDYRTGSRLDMAELTSAAQAARAPMLWDLAHSAGAFEVALDRCNVDLAVGCGYKYLNGGPGAPAFLYVARRHQPLFSQPLSGWMGHQAPFAFDPGYQPADGIGRYLCGTPAVLSLVALEAGVDTLLAAEPLGGLAALREKSLRLTGLFMRLVDERCAGHGLRIITPADPGRRGSQVSLTMDDGDRAHAVVQALINRRVIGDFRAPDVLRFGFTPLTLRFVDVWDAVEALRDILAGGHWNQPRFLQRHAVT